jgi:hypothetical protein
MGWLNAARPHRFDGEQAIIISGSGLPSCLSRAKEIATATQGMNELIIESPIDL